MTGFDELLPQPTIAQVDLWGVVTQASPLRVQLEDGSPGPLPITPDTLVAGLQVGDRVWCRLTTNTNPIRRSRRLVVVGKAGGGSAAALAPWTPTLSGLTQGGGTVDARFVVMGGLFFFEFDFGYGAGSAVGSNPSFTLPAGITLASRYSDLIQPLGRGQCYDASSPTGSKQAIATRGPSNTSMYLYALNVDGSPNSIASTSPMTWTTDDHLYVQGMAELA